jgi:hypothetical protein
MWDFKTSTHNNNWTPGSMGAGYIYAPGNFGGDYTVFDYSIRTWNIGPDKTDDIDKEYHRHLPLHPMVFKFYLDPTGGVHDAGRGFHNMTGKSDESVIEYLHREDSRLHDGRKDVKVERLDAKDELYKYVSSFEPKISHDLSWVKGQKGKGILLSGGKMVTWTVNRKNKPDHLSMYEYLTGEKLPREFVLNSINGFPFDIDENGQISFLGEAPDEVIEDVSKIDYRLTLNKTSASPIMQAPPQGFAYSDKGIMVPQNGGFLPDMNYNSPQPEVGKPIGPEVNMESQEKLMEEIAVDLENLSPDEFKTAISNALRAAIVSPQKSLFLNALDYQAFLDIPYDEDRAKIYEDVYAEKREEYNNLPDEDKVIIKGEPVDKMSNLFNFA